METYLESVISACEWSVSSFLIISENVFVPLIYYSHLGVLIPSLFLALFVFYKDPKKLANRLLFLMIISFAVWIFSDLVLWATEIPSYTMFFWALLNTVEPLVYFFAFYFVYVLLFERDLSFKQKILLSLPLLVTFVLTPTKFGLLGYDLTNCDRAAVEGIAATYGYFIEILYMFLILGFSIYYIETTKDSTKKRHAALITTGVIFFLLSFSAGNILEVFTENWYIGQYGLFGAPVFIGFLAYVMVKYKTFNTKVFGTQILVFAIGILIGSMLFVRYIENIRYVIIGTMALFIPVGYQLIRSVSKEIEQRNKIEKLADELQVANLGQASLIHFMNHQIKGRFGNIKNIFAELGGDDYGTMPPDALPLLKKGLDEANIGVNYVQGILNGASAEKGTISYNMAKIDFKSIVENAFNKQKEGADKKGLETNLELKDGSYEVNGDLLQLGEAVRNLLDNSINYTPTGSIKVSLLDMGNRLRLMIIDTGVGLTVDDKSKLFKSGGRGADSLKVNVNATGYGLVFVKGVIEAHKGRVWAESEGRGKGSTFYMELPKA